MFAICSKSQNRKSVSDRLARYKGELEIYNGDPLLFKSKYITKLPQELTESATDFHNKNKCRCHYNIKEEELMKLLKVKYVASLVDPGEAVGVILAQSLGEPSTQMT